MNCPYNHKCEYKLSCHVEEDNELIVDYDNCQHFYPEMIKEAEEISDSELVKLLLEAKE